MSWFSLIHPAWILFGVRLILGYTMMHYGYPKIRHLAANARAFSKSGFKPGMLWGTASALVQYVGGIMIIAGLAPELAAALFAFQMLVGFLWKRKRGRPFEDYSYNIHLIALSAVVAIFGSGPYGIVSFDTVVFLNSNIVTAAVIAALILVYLPELLGKRYRDWEK